MRPAARFLACLTTDHADDPYTHLGRAKQWRLEVDEGRGYGYPSCCVIWYALLRQFRIPPALLMIDPDSDAWHWPWRFVPCPRHRWVGRRGPPPRARA
jgi:hypothetical protein